MILRISTSITSEPWYPRDRAFTSYEARMDYLLHRGLLTPTEAAARCGWREEEVCDLLKVLEAAHMMPPPKDMYEKEINPEQAAQEVIRIFNQVFDRNIKNNKYRTNLIKKRIKEGNGPKQFNAVFVFKKEEWTGTDQEKYLEIETLLADKHYDKYLDAARKAWQQKNTQTPLQEEGIRLPGRLIKDGAK